MLETAKNALVAAGVALLVVGAFHWLVGSDQPADPLGGTRYPNGISADSTSPSSGQVRGTTLLSTGDTTVGDDLILSASTFCVDFYATSSATQVKMVASSSASGSNVGNITYQYGSCQ